MTADRQKLAETHALHCAIHSGSMFCNCGIAAGIIDCSCGPDEYCSSDNCHGTSLRAKLAEAERKLARGWDETVAADKARAIRAEIRAELAERQLAKVREALRDLLDYAERSKGGDTSLTSESWYAIRDYTRITLASLEGGEEA